MIFAGLEAILRPFGSSWAAFGLPFGGELAHLVHTWVSKGLWEAFGVDLGAIFVGF